MFRDKNNEPQKLLGRLKEYTSNKITKAIKEHVGESRREWMIWMFSRAATKSSNGKDKQLWQHNNKPIELYSSEVINQKINYIHRNPVVAGFVFDEKEWKYSSARNYAGVETVMNIDFI